MRQYSSENQQREQTSQKIYCHIYTDIYIYCTLYLVRFYHVIHVPILPGTYYRRELLRIMRITGEKATHLRLEPNLSLEKKWATQKRNEAEAQQRVKRRCAERALANRISHWIEEGERKGGVMHCLRGGNQLCYALSLCMDPCPSPPLLAFLLQPLCT